MTIEILEEAPPDLEAYARIPIAFRVESRLRVEPLRDGLGGLGLTEEAVDPPYRKDYDEAEAPRSWAERWDLSPWGFFAALEEGQRIGGAAVAWKTEDLCRAERAALWDLRVAPEHRGRGVGARLF